MASWSQHLSAGGVYALTPESVNPDTLLNNVRQALAGGVGMLQYRHKSVQPESGRELAMALRELTREYQVPLIINDHVALASEVGADGVHLGRDDIGIEEARQHLPADCLIGVSCYNDLERAAALARLGADYLAFGSLYPSSTKPGAVRCSTQTLAEARGRFDLPIVAIGGINSRNVGQVAEAGADWVALINGLFDAADIEAAARTLKESLTAAT